MKHKTIIILLATGICRLPVLRAQGHLDSVNLTISKAFQLAVQNSVKLKVIEKDVEIANQNIAIEKSNRLPGISSGLTYGYLSSADEWSPSFSDHIRHYLPHHFTDFSLVASQVVFKGKELERRILKSTLEEQIAGLTLASTTDDIKFLVAAKYLDIYRLINQRMVYMNNIKLAKNRLQNVLAMQRQGIVTQNDVLRTELNISEYKLSLINIENRISIVNNELNKVIGLPDSTRLIPDSSVLSLEDKNEPLSYFLTMGYSENHSLKIAATENKIKENNVQLRGSDRFPVISLYAGNNLQRPFLTSVPAADIYYNVWQGGISIQYNISSIYQTPKKMKESRMELERSKTDEMLTKQNVEIQISTAYIQYNEAKQDLQILKNDLKSAEENYRIVEKKYFNQLALLTDMLDAANTKIEAELRVTNAGIDVAFTYYQLLRSIGTI